MILFILLLKVHSECANLTIEKASSLSGGNDRSASILDPIDPPPKSKSFIDFGSDAPPNATRERIQSADAQYTDPGILILADTI
jgi:hypothetical protein